jgi:hypothetical protein
VRWWDGNHFDERGLRMLRYLYVPAGALLLVAIAGDAGADGWYRQWMGAAAIFAAFLAGLAFDAPRRLLEPPQRTVIRILAPVLALSIAIGTVVAALQG